MERKPKRGTQAWMAAVLQCKPPLVRQLVRAGVTADEGRHRAFGFADLAILRTALALVNAGIGPSRVGAGIVAARGWTGRPLTSLRFSAVDGRVLVHLDGHAYDARTGQQAMTFETRTAATVTTLRPTVSSARARVAHDLYTRASALDERPDTLDEAQRLYEQALVANPAMAVAWTNLGNIHYRRGDVAEAERVYNVALRLDDTQPEAHYNLGYLLLDRGEHAGAIEFMKATLERDPAFTDALFNLAIAYDQSGESRLAVATWKRFLALNPTGTWAEMARHHLQRRPAG